MRLTRGEASWILYPTTTKEEEIFASIVRYANPGMKFQRSEWDRPTGGQATALISAGGSFYQFQGQSHPNVKWPTWIGGIVIPFDVPDDQEIRKMLDTMGVCGLVYTGQVNGGLEVYGTECQYCARRMIDPNECVTQVCANCKAACNHKEWESGHIVITADGGIAMGEQCTRCKMRRGPDADDRADVERTMGVLVITPDMDVNDAVNTLFLPDPPQ